MGIGGGGVWGWLRKGKRSEMDRGVRRRFCRTCYFLEFRWENDGGVWGKGDQVLGNNTKRQRREVSCANHTRWAISQNVTGHLVKTFKTFKYRALNKGELVHNRRCLAPRGIIVIRYIYIHKKS